MPNPLFGSHSEKKKKKQGIQQLFSVFYAVYTGKKVFTYNFGPRT